MRVLIRSQPTVGDRLDIRLLRGTLPEAFAVDCVAFSVPNNGIFSWAPPFILGPDQSRYAIQIIALGNGEYQYSEQFGISQPGYHPYPAIGRRPTTAPEPPKYVDKARKQFFETQVQTSSPILLPTHAGGYTPKRPWKGNATVTSLKSTDTATSTAIWRTITITWRLHRVTPTHTLATPENGFFAAHPMHKHKTPAFAATPEHGVYAGRPKHQHGRPAITTTRGYEAPAVAATPERETQIAAAEEGPSKITSIHRAYKIRPSSESFSTVSRTANNYSASLYRSKHVIGFPSVEATKTATEDAISTSNPETKGSVPMGPVYNGVVYAAPRFHKVPVYEKGPMNKGPQAVGPLGKKPAAKNSIPKDSHTRGWLHKFASNEIKAAPAPRGASPTKSDSGAAFASGLGVVVVGALGTGLIAFILL